MPFEAGSWDWSADIDSGHWPTQRKVVSELSPALQTVSNTLRIGFRKPTVVRIDLSPCS